MLSKKIVKYIQSLSHKKLRDKEGVFIAEGPKVVGEILSSQSFKCKIICATQEWFHDKSRQVPEDDANKYVTDEDSLRKISLLKTPNQVLAIFYKKDTDQHLRLRNKITLVLDDISDPGNLGTIIRIADWFGIENIICSDDCVDCYNPKVVQSTMGSISRVNMLYTNLSSFIIFHENIDVYAATLSGAPISGFKSLAEGFVLIGNESKGINKKLLDISTHQITIPRHGKAESLNAAVATGIILSHLRSQ
jgi:TrmH family RNA methyltransferase